MLTTERDTPERYGEYVNIPLAAATKVYLGALIATNSDGNAVPAEDTAGLRVWGRAEHSVDGTDAEAAELNVNVKRGVFRFDNSETNPVAQEHVGRPCYVEDDETVASDSENLVVAGTVIAVDTTGVWVDTRPASVTAPEDGESA